MKMDIVFTNHEELFEVVVGYFFLVSTHIAMSGVSVYLGRQRLDIIAWSLQYIYVH